jgi:serine/threonine-protein kinase
LAKLAEEKPHPHIVRVFDLFREPHENYPGFEIDCLVMNFIAGETLEMEVHQRGKLPETEAVQYVRQIGDALIEVHKRGLVHWDVTPMNIMISPRKEAVLIDFGIAGDCPPSSFSRKFGNEAFAPYEQLMLGEREKQCDIYTLGASLYYAVTKEVPTFSNARKMRNKPLIEPIQYASISSQVNDAIIWAMALEPGDRPQSMEEWLGAFSGEEEDDLRSDKGVDYRYLQHLLQQQQWKEADMETAKRMLEVAGKKENDILWDHDIDNFPCTDLRTIDQLWVKYSKGQWGFSVQKKIYQSLGGTREYNAEIWRNFGDRVGWREKGEWMDYNDLTFSLSIKCNLPVWIMCGEYSFRIAKGWIVSEVFSFGLESSLASRLVDCNL